MKNASNVWDLLYTPHRVSQEGLNLFNPCKYTILTAGNWRSVTMADTTLEFSTFTPHLAPEISVFNLSTLHPRCFGHRYTGVLPAHAPPQQLLRMVALADQYRVTRFLSAANSSLASAPVASIAINDVISIYALPPFLLDSPAMAVARRRAEEKVRGADS